MIVNDHTDYERMQPTSGDATQIKRIVQALRASPVEMEIDFSAKYDGEWSPFSLRIVCRADEIEQGHNFTWGVFEVDDSSMADKVDKFLIQPILKAQYF